MFRLIGMTLTTVLLSSSLALAYPLTPNPERTPGDLCSTQNPDFKEYRYQEKVPYCQRNVSYETKTRIYQDYGIPNSCRGRFTVDHLIPLSMGGSNEPTNLWPEHTFVKQMRPELELETYERLRSGELTQAEAIAIILEAKRNPQIMELMTLGCDTQELLAL